MKVSRLSSVNTEELLLSKITAREEEEFRH